MAEVLDALILAWLIGTWFFEGNHKRCKVIVSCEHGGKEVAHDCENR